MCGMTDNCPIRKVPEKGHFIDNSEKENEDLLVRKGRGAKRGIRSLLLQHRKVRHQRHTMAPAVVRWAQERAIQLKVILYKNFKVSVLAHPQLPFFLHSPPLIFSNIDNISFFSLLVIMNINK